jgi:hypothetical protein
MNNVFPMAVHSTSSGSSKMMLPAKQQPEIWSGNGSISWGLSMMEHCGGG